MFVAGRGLEPLSFSLWDWAGTISSPPRNVYIITKLLGFFILLLILPPSSRIWTLDFLHVKQALLPGWVKEAFVGKVGFEPTRFTYEINFNRSNSILYYCYQRNSQECFEFLPHYFCTPARIWTSNLQFWRLLHYQLCYWCKCDRT